MSNYVAILRGINVSGHNMIRMPALKDLFLTLGFTDVQTYIQSGNVVFRAGAKWTVAEIPALIGKAILTQFHCQVPVIIRSREEIQNVSSSNPFLSEEGIDVSKLHVTFLSAVPAAELPSLLKVPEGSPDRFTMSGSEVYLHCPGGYGNTKLNNSFFENKLKVTATTRNWNTVLTLARMLQEL